MRSAPARGARRSPWSARPRRCRCPPPRSARRCRRSRPASATATPSPGRSGWPPPAWPAWPACPSSRPRSGALWPAPPAPPTAAAARPPPPPGPAPAAPASPAGSRSAPGLRSAAPWRGCSRSAERAGRTRPGRPAPPPRAASVRRQVVVPLAQRLERRPELALGGGVVQRAVDVGYGQQVDRGGERPHLAEAELDRRRKRELERSQERDGVLTHRHDDAGLGDVQLVGEPCPRLGEVVRPRVDVDLQAYAAVQLQRVDAQPLDALQHRLAGPAEEGHALLHLRSRGPVLEQEDVGQRVAGADHRRLCGMVVADPGRDLMAELVGLGDGAGLVSLVDLIVGHAHSHILAHTRPKPLPRDPFKLAGRAVDHLHTCHASPELRRQLAWPHSSLLRWWRWLRAACTASSSCPRCTCWRSPGPPP